MPQAFRLPQISTDKGLDKKKIFDEKTGSDWSQLASMNDRAKIQRVPFMRFFKVACVKDELDADGLTFHTKAEFSNAVSVMDKIGGWDEGDEQEDQIGARFGASLWIFTKAVVCNCQRNMENFMINKMNSITVAGMEPRRFHEDRGSVRGAVEDVVVLGSNQP